MQRDFGARAQLYETVLLLASEKGSIEERLRRAYFLHLDALDISGLPASTQQKLEQIRTELKELYPERDKVDGVDRNVAVTLALAIILLYDELAP